MDNNTYTTVPPVTTPPTPPVTPIEPKKSEVGPIVATILIIVIIILGGLYFWGKRIETEKNNQALQSDNTNIEMAASIEATRIETVSQDDSLDSLEAEISGTNTTNIDSGL